MLDTIRTNMDDLDSRISSSTSTFVIFNELINQNEERNGSLKWSFESEANFQAENGNGWSLIDGSTGSYKDKDGSTVTIPTAQLHFLMNKGGASVDEESVSISARDTLNPRTKLPNSSFSAVGVGDHTHTALTGGGGVSGGGVAIGEAYPNLTSGAAGAHGHSISGGDAVNRPKSLVANLFIKVKPNTGTKLLIYRASKAITLTTAKVTNLVAGASGTAEIDIKIGSSLSSVSSVFSTKPSVAYTGGDYVTSTNAAFSTTSVSINDFIVLDITNVQDVDPRLFVQLEGESS